MRLRRLTAVACAVAVSTAVSSLAWLATGASAFQHPSPGGRCRVSIYAPLRVTAGEPVTIFGRLVCRRQTGAAGQVVRLFRHVPGTPGFALVQVTTTNAQGIYEFQPVAGGVEENSVWHVRSHGAESANRRISVAPEVTLDGPPEGTVILTGAAGKVAFTGTVTPADVGAQVILQRQNALTGNEWHRIDSGTVVQGGGFSITHTFVVPGDANIRVLVLSQGRNAPGASSPLTYEISQAQNPALTINASADPIAFGQSVTIGGVVAKGANWLVTLEARTVGHPFAQVAQVKTDANGNYSFPPQMPVSNTFYRVHASVVIECAAGQPVRAPCAAPPLSSAVLYEGVREVLTAQVSLTSVLAGETLTFTGSAAPSHPGHVIYLERQNASGTGFHVVQLSTLSRESTFSIAYQVYAPGTDVFRVYFPGGPDNESAASPLFTIKVSPAPAAALRPESPGNTTAPEEGSTSPAERERAGEERGGEREPTHEGHHHR